MNKEEISLLDEHQFETKENRYELKTIGEDSNLIKSKDRVQHYDKFFLSEG